MLISPYGSSQLLPRLLSGEELDEAKKRSASLPQVPISSQAFGDLIMLGVGGFTPLTGFMNYVDWYGVCADMHLFSGLFWPIPITLSVSQTQANALKIGDDIALIANQTPVAILKLTEKFMPDKVFECEQIFKTRDPNHPGVANRLKEGEICLAGPVQVLSLGDFKETYPEIFLTPMETRNLFEQRHWKTIAAFQTRNPMHRAHEYLAKAALEKCDGLFIHSILGHLKSGDIPAEVSVKAIQVLVENHFPAERVLRGGYSLDMRYAGPREALLHALFRQNYGCTHLIVGRDHAGVGNYYGPYDAQKIFDDIPKDALKIQPIKMDAAFWCYACNNMATRKTCHHDDKDHLALSGTALRTKLEQGEAIPEEFSRPEVVMVLREYYTK